MVSIKLIRNDLCHLLKLELTHPFIFGDKLYKQIYGVEMGSYLGPTVANTFLCRYKNIWLNEFPPQFKPLVYTHHIDDIFVLFKSKEHLKVFVNYANSENKNIKLTFKDKYLNNFAFLDVKITRENKWFVTSIFCKATFSGVSIDYDTYKILIIPNISFLIPTKF